MGTFVTRNVDNSESIEIDARRRSWVIGCESKKANKESERTAGRGNEEKGRHAKGTRMKWALYSSS